MSICVDNPALGLIGCAQSYGGELQHSVARVPWSEHPDSRAHVTASVSVIDRCWSKGRGQMAEPSTIGLTQRDGQGQWRVPLRPERVAALAEIAQERLRAVRMADETTVGVL